MRYVHNIIAMAAMFFGIWYTFINGVNAIRGHALPAANIIIMSACWVVVLYYFGLLSNYLR